jgi:hypothetical protein
MPREKSSTEPTFGFLSTLESPDYGHFGGYLIVSPLGRPVEFHCTSPVRPSRAQEILYGPTLQPYLLGEQISGALLKAAKNRPSLILVDADAMLLARTLTSSPMALVAPRARTDANSLDSENDPARQFVAFARGGVSQFDAHIEVGGYGLILPSGFEDERHTVAERATQLSQHVDLAEPFGRIQEAIREAQRISGRAGDAHGQAA